MQQRHTARRIFDRLREEHGHTGRESIVRAAVADWKKTRAEAFVPLAHPPGEAQVDFGHAEVVVGGERVTAAFFVMTLPHSGAFFVRAYPRGCTASFRGGHCRAAGGAPGIGVSPMISSQSAVRARDMAGAPNQCESCGGGLHTRNRKTTE
jgi:transposase